MTRPPMAIDDETLMALADGELAPDLAADLRSRIAADPALAARYALFDETRQMVQAAMAAGPVPDRLIRTVLDTPLQRPAEPAQNVVPLTRPRRPRERAGWAPMALAASLALAAVGSAFVLGRASAPATGTPAQVAAVALAGAATGQSADLPGGGTARVLASYDTDRGLCRLIDVAPPAAGGERAIVCRDGAGWAVALSVAGTSGGAYLPASDTAVELIDGFLDGLAASAPLSAADEAAALRR